MHTTDYRSVNLGTPSRMMDRLRESAAVIYVEGRYTPRSSLPTPTWTPDQLSLGHGITTSRVDSSHTVTLSTIVLVDAEIYANRSKYFEASLEFCIEDKPGSYKLCYPDSEEGQGGQWMPLVQTTQRGMRRPNIADWPIVQGIWRVVLNVGAMEPRNVEYLNGDRFDLHAANLRLIDA